MIHLISQQVKDKKTRNKVNRRRMMLLLSLESHSIILTKSTSSQTNKKGFFQQIFILIISFSNSFDCVNELIVYIVLTVE